MARCSIFYDPEQRPSEEREKPESKWEEGGWTSPLTSSPNQASSSTVIRLLLLVVAPSRKICIVFYLVFQIGAFRLSNEKIVGLAFRSKGRHENAVSKEFAWKIECNF